MVKVSFCTAVFIRLDILWYGHVVFIIVFHLLMQSFFAINYSYTNVNFTGLSGNFRIIMKYLLAQNLGLELFGYISPTCWHKGTKKGVFCFFVCGADIFCIFL